MSKTTEIEIVKSKVCGAKLRGKDATCQIKAIHENGRCRLHGGKSLRGMASPTFKTGTFSKYLPENIKDRAEESETNESLVELREQIALFKTRLGFLAPRLKGTPDHQTWILLSSAFHDAMSNFDSIAARLAEAAETEEDEQTLQEFTQRIEFCREIVNSALESDSAWLEMQQVSEHIRRLVETEAKRMKDLDLYIPAEQANLLIVNLAQANKTILREIVGQVFTENLYAVTLQKIGEAFQKMQEFSPSDS